MTISRIKKGFTLVEMLVAVSIFAIVAVISSNILVDVVQVEKKSSIQNAFFQDARIILQQLTNEIQAGTIDYEEYFNQNVVDSIYYGINYGAYSSRFYAPGKSLFGPVTVNPDNLGAECSFPERSIVPGDPECEVVYNLSADINTGENPFNSGASDSDSSNAFCDDPGGTLCANTNNVFNELYLIDSTGTQKTILGRKRTDTNDHAIGLLRMSGMDLDQNGIMDIFSCDPEFNCNDQWDQQDMSAYVQHPLIDSQADVTQFGIRLPHRKDLDTVFDPVSSYFIPITPLASDIQDLKFIINPIEDPYKAFSEPSVQNQPSVTIILTLGLSEEAAASYPGDFEPVTVQSTVAAGVLKKIDAYPPTNDLSWLSNLGLSTTP